MAVEAGSGVGASRPHARDPIPHSKSTPRTVALDGVFRAWELELSLCTDLPIATAFGIARVRRTSIISWEANRAHWTKVKASDQSPAPNRYCHAMPKTLKSAPLRAVSPELK